jgi:hypothetical protein
MGRERGDAALARHVIADEGDPIEPVVGQAAGQCPKRRADRMRRVTMYRTLLDEVPGRRDH